MTQKSETAAVASVLSFEYFIEYINKRIETSSVSSDYLIKARDEIVRHFDHDDYTVSGDDIKKYEAVFRQIYLIMVSPLENENEVFWGLSPVFSSDFFYGTNALQSLYNEFHGRKLISIPNFENKSPISEQDLKEMLLYSLIVKRLYGYDIFHHADMIMRVADSEAEKFYQFDFNESFAQVFFKGELPEMDINLTEKEDFDDLWILMRLRKKLPLDRIELRGFSTIVIKDVTFKMLKERLKSLFLTQSIDSSFHTDISATTKQIIGNNEVDMLILPILELDGKIVRELWQNFENAIASVLKKYKVKDDDFFKIIQRFVIKPNIIFRDSIQKNRESNSDLFSTNLRNILSGLIMYPVKNAQGLTGVVIVMSPRPGLFSDLKLSHLDDLLPLLQNMFNSLTANYLGQLDQVIKNQFTAIQPSVAWKFHSAGIQFIKDRKSRESPAMSPISFDDVFPIFGAIDFRNSTLERNKAQFEDFLIQLEELKAVFKSIFLIKEVDILDQLIYQSEHWIETLKTKTVSTNEESQIMNFLKNDSVEILKKLGYNNSDIKKITKPYLKRSDDQLYFHQNKSALEETFTVLNSAIIYILDDLNKKLQDTYPCYFERYRSDGVEFNLYIGQSISPDKPFSNFYVKNARLWQLNMMASVARITEAAQDLFSKKIRTTQLIFVHPSTISVSFRNDEKRFDVEGSYNIRYEVAKKRIDKAMVKDTNERLTQPRKISIVYYHKNDIEDYLQHIIYLQNRGVLAQDMEELELEDMQGISGLKAIRVEIGDFGLDLKEQKYLSKIKNQNQDHDGL